MFECFAMVNFEHNVLLETWLIGDSLLSSFQNSLDEERQASRWNFLLAEIPILPDHPYGFGNELSIRVRLGFDNLEHLLEALVFPYPVKVTEYIEHVQDVVPEQRSLQLAEVRAHVEDVRVFFFAVLPKRK